MADIPREMLNSGATLPFMAAPETSTPITKSTSEATMNADVRLRTRFDMDNVQVPRAELASMVFFERRRRDEENKDYLLKMRMFDDPAIVQNKPFQLFPKSYRFPMQCTRLAFVQKNALPSAPLPTATTNAAPKLPYLTANR